jgi:hypothetical protein
MMTPRKPQKTAADYMVIALSPALIMALVGSLCFFLVEVFYHGQMEGSVRWVLFWFVLGVVLVSRLGIEQTPEHAALYGLALGLAVWLYLVRTHPSYLIGLVLLAIVWFCAHKLVWDCTLIDDDQDASGAGLLQSSGEPKRKKGDKRARRGRPGLWVVWFSLAALPLFGLGQALLPPGGAARRWGFGFLVLYMAAALGLLVTTSFLGLRRYLRQRYLQMPPVIALAWLKFGVGIALLILIGAVFLPRPGVNLVWAAARSQVDYRLRQASRYASRINPHGQGEGRAGNDTGPSGKEETPTGNKPQNEGGAPKPSGNRQATPTPASAPVASLPAPPPAAVYNFLRAGLFIIVAAIAGWWLFRCRYLLLELARSIIASVRDFFRRLLDLAPGHKPTRRSEPAAAPLRLRPLAEYRNPFYATGEHAWPQAEIILYTYDAVQSWASEQGIQAHPEQTPREFCEEMADRLPELSSPMRQLAFLYAHAAYGERLPAHCDLEPLKDIWRQLAAGPATEKFAN